MINDATLAQHRAANPATSTWLSANAGSGKTKVLIDRVARLLLSGVSPQHILCLTYTKAAATEMQNRLFERLGAWAMMPEPALRAALTDLGHGDGAPLAAADLAHARQLFARAIESPGGLRIQTIHSFCATLLRRFPLEAGVSPAFQEMDDRAAKLLREDIIEEMAQTLAPDTIRDIARYHSGTDFHGLMAAVAGEAEGFAQPLTLAQAKQMFGLTGNETEAGLVDQVLMGDGPRIVSALLPYLQAGSITDVKAGDKLGGVDLLRHKMSVLAGLESVFLYGESAAKAYGAKIDKFPTKATRTALPRGLSAQLDAFMLRVEAARPQRIALFAAQKTAALHTFTGQFLPLYARAKAARGLLDFDDLISRAIHLLTDHSVAAWVLFRLDGGIDHILVDEAQDTSPRQWQVIELLAAEFTTGAGAQTRPRTLFVVGDKKQSIYSFQGADTAVFDEKQRLFKEKFDAVGLPLIPAELQYSFRSSPAVLRVVDNIFHTRYPTAMGPIVQHLAHHSEMAGRVDLWPVIEDVEKPDPIDPTDTTPRVANASAQWELAQKVAEAIRAILAKGTIIPTKSGIRAARAGDVLVLVQRRSAIFHHIIRACKKLDLPIAGADRLRLGGEMAVRDLTALLAFLATPEDDLSLAAALRSPLLGLSEAQLFDLASGPRGYLWEKLRGSDHAQILEILTDLRNQSDYLRPYDVLERLLTRHDGRRRLIARLGAEAEEGIDELLSQALAFEVGQIPSLTGFLLWLEGDDVTVKRQMDTAGDQIRVMTVHGAKGLEAPIVILPDCANRNTREGGEIIPLAGGLAWRTNADDSPAQIAEATARNAQASEDERLRLLYVALTRAQSWLIVAAAGKVSKPETWHNLVRQGMDAAGSIAISGGVLRHEFGQWPQLGAVQSSAADAPAILPDWAQSKVAPMAREALPFAPSRLTGAKTVAGDTQGDPDALDYGTAVHLMLEHLPHLPQSDWPDVAARLSPDAAAYAEALSVLNAPHLADVFAQGLPEVTLTAPMDKGQMLGVIDRLIVTENRLLAVDFKTNSVVPANPADVPTGLLAQMGAYLGALQQIYPNHRIEIAILWTRTATLMPLDHDIMSRAFARAAVS
jgi:ATP-dependent helicase/nuclease subunit A